MPRLPKEKWVEARHMFEQGGMSSARIAKVLGVSETTVQRHKQEEGWERGNPEDGPDLADKIEESFAPEQRVAAEDVPQIDLAVKVAELERQLADAEEASGIKKVNLYETVEDVLRIIPEAELRDRALSMFRKINRDRARMGLEPYRDEEQIQVQMRKIAEELVDKRTRFSGESDMRTVKLWYGNRMVAYPVEVQFNNEAAAAGASLHRMRDKGAKLIEPYLCQRGPCWLPAAKIGNQFANRGYCGPRHESGDPYFGAAALRTGDQAETPPVAGAAMAR